VLDVHFCRYLHSLLLLARKKTESEVSEGDANQSTDGKKKKGES
jgi:hypothetical protein